MEATNPNHVGLYDGILNSHSGAPSQGEQLQSTKRRRSPAFLCIAADIFSSKVCEIVLAHCNGSKQIPPTISWVWVLWAEARRNLKEVVLFWVLEFARTPKQQYVYVNSCYPFTELIWMLTFTNLFSQQVSPWPSLLQIPSQL